MSFALQAQIHVRPDALQRYMPLLLENAKCSREEPGCHRFDIFVDPHEPTRLMLLEVYADEHAFESHLSTEHFRRYGDEAVPLLASRERKVWRFA